MTMMATLTNQNKNQAKPFKPKVYLRKGEVKVEISTVTTVDSKIKIGHITEIDLECHNIESDLNLDKTLGDKISEKESEEILGRTTHLTGVEIGKETGSI